MMLMMLGDITYSRFISCSRYIVYLKSHPAAVLGKKQEMFDTQVIISTEKQAVSVLGSIGS